MRNKKKIVIKAGTSALTYPHGDINLNRISKLACVLTDLRSFGREIVFVTSGAVTVGAKRLKLAARPEETRVKQAASAVGQAILMQMYEKFFAEFNQVVAQVLLTKDVLDGAALSENAVNTFTALFEMGVIPIVNENDAISVEELGFSDNDALSADVACLLKRDLLIILSDIKGLYDGDPSVNPDAKFIGEIFSVNETITCLAAETKSQNGTGGMGTKLAAAKQATENGIDVIITSGENPSELYDILNGKNIGTLFHAVK